MPEDVVCLLSIEVRINFAWDGSTYRAHSPVYDDFLERLECVWETQNSKLHSKFTSKLVWVETDENIPPSSDNPRSEIWEITRIPIGGE
jgi:hypothetical protein